MEIICALWTTSASTAPAVTSVESLWRGRWWPRSERPTTQHALCAQSASKSRRKTHSHTRHYTVTDIVVYGKPNTGRSFKRDHIFHDLQETISCWRQSDIQWQGLSVSVLCRAHVSRTHQRRRRTQQWVQGHEANYILLVVFVMLTWIFALFFN